MCCSLKRIYSQVPNFAGQQTLRFTGFNIHFPDKMFKSEDDAGKSGMPSGAERLGRWL